MPRSILLAVALLMLPSTASAESVRPASPAEFGKLLLGCWHQERSSVRSGVRLFESSEACFHPNGKVDAFWFGGSSAAPGEGLEDSTRYRVTRGRLIFDGPAGWIQAYRMACGATISPGRQLSLSGCVDDGVGPDGKRVDSTPVGDFTFKAEPGHTELHQ